MKRKAAIRELVRMRDAGEIGPWERPYGVWRRSVQGWDHADFVLAATEHKWLCYVPLPGSTRTFKEGICASSVEEAKVAADAWLNGLTADDCKSKSQQIQELQDQVKYLEEQLLHTKGGF